MNIDDVVYSYEAEAAVIGCILVKPELIDSCFLDKTDFYDPRHIKIMEFFMFLNEVSSEKIDINLIVAHAKTDEELNQLGGFMYLTQLIDHIATISNFKKYHDTVKEKSIIRHAMNIMRLKANDGLHTDNSKDYLSDTIQALEDLSGEVEDDEEPIRLGSVLDDHEEIMIKRALSAGLTGTKTCSTDLDALTGGWQKKNLNIIGARPSIGKTAMLVNEAEAGQIDAMKKGLGATSAALIISIEQPELPIAERALCALGNIDGNLLKTGELSDKDWERYYRTKHHLNQLNIFIEDKPSITVQSIKRKVKKLLKKYPNVTLYIDYLQLVNCGNKKINHDPTKNAKAVSVALKQIARELDIPVVAISAVGRKCEERQDKRPQMSDLRDSGSVESDADVIVFLYRDDYYNRESQKVGIIELIVAKNRDGPVGLVEMVFIKSTGKFFKRKIADGAA